MKLAGGDNLRRCRVCRFLRCEGVDGGCKVIGTGQAGGCDVGEEALFLEGEHEIEVEVSVGDVGDGEARFGDVLEVGADVGEVYERHFFCFYLSVDVCSCVVGGSLSVRLRRPLGRVRASSRS